MWDVANSQSFTKSQALAYVGKTVNTNAGVRVKITGIFCDGPDEYLLLDEQGNFFHRVCNNGCYVIDD